MRNYKEKEEVEKVIESIKEKNYKYVKIKLIKWIARDFILKGIPIGLLIGLIAIIPYHFFDYEINTVDYIEILTFSALFYAVLRAIFIATKEEQMIYLTQVIEDIQKEEGKELDEKTIENSVLYARTKEFLRNLFLIFLTFLVDTGLAKFFLL